MAGVAAAYRHSLGSDDGREGRDGRAVQLGCRAVLHCTRAAISRTTSMHAQRVARLLVCRAASGHAPWKRVCSRCSGCNKNDDAAPAAVPAKK